MTAVRDRPRRAGRPLRARAAGAALLAALTLVVLTLAGCGTAGYGASVAPSRMSVSSEAFVSGILPQRYTCHGEKMRPPLNWSGAPEGTKSIALIVDDSSAPITPTIYWLVFDINPGATDIQEGALPTGARQATEQRRYGYVRRPLPARPPALVPVYRLCLEHHAEAARRRAAAGRMDRDRGGHNRARTNSGNRKPVIIQIRLVISIFRNFFNPVTRSRQVSNNR